MVAADSITENMENDKFLSKKEIVKRLHFIIKHYKPEQREITLDIIFDTDIWTKWNNHEFFSERFSKIDEKPHDIFVVRKSIINKMEKDSREKLSLKELKEIFLGGDETNLGEFKKTGTEDDIVNKINFLYFGSYGNEVFTTKSGRSVPNKLSNHFIFEKSNARLLYELIKKEQIQSNTYKVLKLGNGSKVDAHYAFFNEIKTLDRENKTNVFEKLAYIISDLSLSNIEQVKKEFLKNSFGKELIEKNILQFKVVDGLKVREKFNNELSMIESSYLYDSMSQPILAKVDGEFYEVWVRAVISDSFDIKSKDKNKVSMIEFKKMIDENNLDNINKLKPETFNAIRFEKLLKKTDIKNHPYYEEIIESLKDSDNITFSTIDTMIESIKNVKDSLINGGVFQTFDFGIKEKDSYNKLTGSYVRYNGNITTPINFPLLKLLEPKLQLKIKVESSTSFVYNAIKEKVISIIDVIKLLKSHDIIRNFFPYSQHQFFQTLVELDNKIKEKISYNEKGLQLFIKALEQLKLIEWKSEKWIEMHKEKENYLFDFFESVYLYLIYNRLKKFSKKHIFIYEKSDNEEFFKILADLKFNKEVIFNFFPLFEELSSKESYVYFEALKTEDYIKKNIVKEEKPLDKISNLMNLIDKSG